MQLDRDRLAKLPSMLGSDHDGEALAAARTVEKLRREAGLDWFAILTTTNSIAEEAALALLAENEQLRARLAALETHRRPLPVAGPEDLNEAIELCLLWRRRLSHKQQHVVWRIVDKIGRLIRMGAA